MKYLITGGCGFLGSNLASEAIRGGEAVWIFDNLSRQGSLLNKQWLDSLGKYTFVSGDIRNLNDIERVIVSVKPDIIFHLAGQVAMTTSIEDPRKDFEINSMGTFNLLDSIRKYSPGTKIIYSSTNKVYGDLEYINYTESETRYTSVGFEKGFPETIPLEFHSPYGCSKGAADQYMLDFHRIFGLQTMVFRHSSMYGGRQYATYDQGWVGWFCEQAILQKNNRTSTFTISGNGKQVRDLLYVDDMINLYFKASNADVKAWGRAYNIGGGVDNSLSLLELFSVLEKFENIQLKYDKASPRISDQKVFVADVTKAKSLIGWSPNCSYKDGIEKMLNWVQNGKK